MVRAARDADGVDRAAPNSVGEHAQAADSTGAPIAPDRLELPAASADPAAPRCAGPPRQRRARRGG
eukprot:1036703-Rhodomonas_salina.1